IAATPSVSMQKKIGAKAAQEAAAAGGRAKEAAVTPKRAQAWRTWPMWSGALLLGACGCAPFWDEVTSREFEFKSLWSKPPEPLVVLRDSTDNQRKAEALARLQEPLSHGGTREQHEVFLQILTRAALNEDKGQFEPMSRDPLCR